MTTEGDAPESLARLGFRQLHLIWIDNLQDVLMFFDFLVFDPVGYGQFFF